MPVAVVLRLRVRVRQGVEYVGRRARRRHGNPMRKHWADVVRRGAGRCFFLVLGQPVGETAAGLEGAHAGFREVTADQGTLTRGYEWAL